MAPAPRDQNFVPAVLFESSTNPGTTITGKINEATGRILTTAAGGSGTVTSVSVVSANGFAGTVATATTTPAITLTTTITGILQGNGTAISAASTTGSGAVVLANSPTFTDDITLGTAASATGSILFKGTTSGTVTLSVADAAGTWTMKLPTTDGDAGQFLQTDGAGNTTWAASSASAGGNNTEVQYNNGGALGGITGATSNGTTLTITSGRATTDFSPSSNDGAALGTIALGFSDLHLATGAVINWANGEVTLTETDANTLTLAGATTLALGTTDITMTGSLGTTGARLTKGWFTDLEVTNAIAGSITGNAATVTVADESADTTCFLNFTTAVSGSLSPKTNTNMTFNALTGVATFASTVLTTTDINGGTIDGVTIGGASAGAGTFTAITGERLIVTGSTVPANGVYLPAASTLGFAVNSAGEVQLTSTALSPIANDGNALGTTTLGWADLHLATGGVINWANGEVTITETDANTLTIAGATSVSLGTSAALTTGTIELGAASDTTLARSAAGQMSIEGVQVVTLSNTVTMTNKTLQHTFEPPTDDTFTGETLQGMNAGATVAQWDCVYLNTSTQWVLTDADAASSAGGVMVAMATAAGTAANPLTVLLRGVVRNDGWTWATVGAPLYLDTTTAGGLTLTAPSGTDDVVKIVGYVLSDDCIYFNPSNDWITRV